METGVPHRELFALFPWKYNWCGKSARACDDGRLTNVWGVYTVAPLLGFRLFFFGSRGHFPLIAFVSPRFSTAVYPQYVRVRWLPCAV